MQSTNKLELSTIKYYYNIWITAVIVQCDKVIETHKLDSDNSYVQDYFFIISLNKLENWLFELKKSVPNLNSHIDAFFKSFPELKSLRNMREHEIDYLKGKGWHQDEYSKDVSPFVDFNQFANLKIDAHVTIMTKDLSSIIVGGRLNVGKIKTETIKLQNTLKDLIEK
jgi:hypothetical protein